MKSAFAKGTAITAFALLATTTTMVGNAADAVAGLRRCEARDGTAIYTDKTCAVFDARPSSLSHELLTRIAMADAAPVEGLSMGVYRDASEPMPIRPAIRRSPSGGCARTPVQLSADLLGSFALHDVNRVAESYHWAGMNQRQALPVMKQLERLSAEPLADARFLAAWIGSGDLSSEEIPTDAGLMQLVFAGVDARAVDLPVRRYAGCYFVSF